MLQGNKAGSHHATLLHPILTSRKKNSQQTFRPYTPTEGFIIQSRIRSLLVNRGEAKSKIIIKALAKPLMYVV